jgi:putative transcriptional regulator
MNAAPHYHPDQFLLQDYAAGDVPGAIALTLSVHLEYCPRCRADARDLAGIGGELLGSLDPVPVTDDAFARLMERVESTPAPVRPLRPAAREASGDALPRALASLVPQGLDALQWNRTGKLRSTRLAFGDREREVALQHIAAGGRVLEHGHRGSEITVVLRGRFSDADGLYQRGDFLLRGPEDVHRPVAAEDEDCLCLAVLDAPLRFNGLLGVVANPFMRIHPR